MNSQSNAQITNHTTDRALKLKCGVFCPKAIISSRKSQVLQCELWDWDPGMGIQNDDYLGRSVFQIVRFWQCTLIKPGVLSVS